MAQDIIVDYTLPIDPDIGRLDFETSDFDGEINEVYRIDRSGKLYRSERRFIHSGRISVSTYVDRDLVYFYLDLVDGQVKRTSGPFTQRDGEAQAWVSQDRL